jgi:hypothetical protein
MKTDKVILEWGLAAGAIMGCSEKGKQEGKMNIKRKI